ncbi:hypothetical protein Ptr902_06040 [Pyrenophora tritici-repentis]|nr:hypothetical protein Ptr902_06040 [Pyrenophora tritici-repentis]
MDSEAMSYPGHNFLFTPSDDIASFQDFNFSAGANANLYTIELGNDGPLFDWRQSHGTPASPGNQMGKLFATKSADSGATGLTMLINRVIPEREKKIPMPEARTAAVVDSIRELCRGRRRGRALAEKIENVLSPTHQLCLSELLRATDSSVESSNSDFAILPADEMIEGKFLASHTVLSLFINLSRIKSLHEKILTTTQPSISIEETTLFITTLAWGALLNPKVDRSMTVDLLDTVHELSSVLSQQRDSEEKFLALVAILCLGERTSAGNLHSMIFSGASTAATLGLHLGVRRRQSVIDKQEMGEVDRAMWMLYCIEKSYGLQWRIFSILGEDFLPTAAVLSERLAPVDALSIRSEYSKICSKILRLRSAAKAGDSNASEMAGRKVQALAAELERWHASTLLEDLSHLRAGSASRLRLQWTCRYHEALLCLSILGPGDFTTLQSGGPARDLRARSLSELITSCSGVSSSELLQNTNYTYVCTLATCLLVIDVLCLQDGALRKEDRALLSISCGFFAQIGFALPRSCLFEHINELVEFLTST